MWGIHLFYLLPTFRIIGLGKSELQHWNQYFVGEFYRFVWIFDANVIQIMFKMLIISVFIVEYRFCHRKHIFIYI